MNKGLKYLIFTLSVIAFVAVMSLIYFGRKNSLSMATCTGVDVKIKDEFKFVNKSDVETYLAQYYGSYIGQRIDSVNLSKIETMLDRQSAVLKSEAWTTQDGLLHISITQREPVVRFQRDSSGFYIDDRGFIFPLQSNYSSLVPVIDGKIPISTGQGFKGEARSAEEREWISDILEMIRYMQHSKVWADNIVQMSVNDAGDLLLVPREGHEKFIFGSPKDAKAKFERIGEYYSYIKPSKEENYYNTVNVKYNGQIICRQ